jgi:Tol biopolymer transport system component
VTRLLVLPLVVLALSLTALAVLAVSGGRGTDADLLAYIHIGQGGRQIGFIDVGQRIHPALQVSGGADCTLDWSADGDQLAYIDAEAYIAADVFVFDLFKRRARQITYNRDEDIVALLAASQPKWYDGDLIFVSWDSGDPDLTRADPDLRRVTVIDDLRRGAEVFRPEMLLPAPDDHRLVLLARHDGVSNLYKVTDEPQHLRTINDGDHIAWSPDGTQLVFHERDRRTINLYVFDPATGDTRQLTDNGSGEVSYNPVWGGDDIFYLDRRARDDTRIGVVPAGGGEPRILPLPHFTEITDLIVSPDGKRLAFVARNALREGSRYESFTPYHLYTSHADGSALRRLVTGTTDGSSYITAFCGLAWQP